MVRESEKNDVKPAGLTQAYLRTFDVKKLGVPPGFSVLLAGACKFGTAWAGLRIIHHHGRANFTGRPGFSWLARVLANSAPPGVVGARARACGQFTTSTEPIPLAEHGGAAPAQSAQSAHAECPWRAMPGVLPT